ncbi:unnamed protein product [Sphacelaria rigidula]
MGFGATGCTREGAYFGLCSRHHTPCKQVVLRVMFFPAITMGFKQTSPIRCSVWCDENEEGAESIFLRQAPTPHPNVVAPRGSYVYFSSLWGSVHALYFSFSHTHTPRLLV